MDKSTYAVVLQEKILDKYGSLYGISKDIVDRIGKGTATSAELTTYTENADRVVEKFKTDMRSTVADDYTDADVEIIIAMAATNYANYDGRDDPFAKIVPAAHITDTLGKNAPPAFFGFAASQRHSADLAPDQMVSQFGLDYETKDKDGNTQTPYLVGGKPQPFVYSVESPMTKEIRATAKIPFDPRIFERIEKLAKDPASSGTLKEMAQMVTQPGVACLIVRNDLPESDKQEMITRYEERGYIIKKSMDAPYTGNAMPQYGTNLDGKSCFSDLVQEMYFDTSQTKALGAEGTSIYLAVPKKGSSSTDDPTLPRGSDRVEIARWDGRRWEMTVTQEQLDQYHDQALSGFSDADKATLKSRLVTHDTLTTAYTQGHERESAGAELKPQAKKGIKDRENGVKRNIVAEKLGSLVAALRFTDKGKDKDKKKKKKKNVDGSDEHHESQRKSASSGE